MQTEDINYADYIVSQKRVINSLFFLIYIYIYMNQIFVLAFQKQQKKTSKLDNLLCAKSVNVFKNVKLSSTRLRRFYMCLIKRAGDVGKYERTKVELLIKFWCADTAISPKSCLIKATRRHTQAHAGTRRHTQADTQAAQP